ncbi:MAG: hypothetical protein AB7V55_06025, partial [Oscillospiraceae bacterium]
MLLAGMVCMGCLLSPQRHFRNFAENTGASPLFALIFRLLRACLHRLLHRRKARKQTARPIFLPRQARCLFPYMRAILFCDLTLFRFFILFIYFSLFFALSHLRTQTQQIALPSGATRAAPWKIRQHVFQEGPSPYSTFFMLFIGRIAAEGARVFPSLPAQYGRPRLTNPWPLIKIEGAEGHAVPVCAAHPKPVAGTAAHLLQLF